VLIVLLPDVIEEILGKPAALAPGNHAGRRANTPGMHARLGGPRQGTPFSGSRDDEERVASFLRSSANSMVSDDLRCSECRKAASYLQPDEAFLPRPSRSAQRG
jgi:hypothetical protein